MGEKALQKIANYGLDPLLTKKRTKLPRVEDQKAPPPRVDPDEEYKERKFYK